jgi:hypothetical protein
MRKYQESKSRQKTEQDKYGKRDSARCDAAAMESITRDWRGSRFDSGTR